jgi:Mn2+/Fe2+ NRAMP family transporter
VTEAVGLEKGVSQDFREAPTFMGLFTGMFITAAGLALIPGIPFTSTLIVVQVLNGMALPIVLVSLLRLTNDRDLMGDRVNTRAFNVIGVATTAVVVSLSVLLVIVTMVQLFA